MSKNRTGEEEDNVRHANTDAGTMSTIHVRTSNSYKDSTGGAKKIFSESQTGF